MTAYIVRRLGLSVLVLLGVTVIVFGLIHLAPGDPARLMLPDGAPNSDVEIMRQALGLDQPLATQYFIFLTNALRGDLGKSLYFKEPALRIITDALPATLTLTLAALTLALVVAIPMGVLSAVRRDTPADYFGMFIATIGQAVPVYWLGLMLILLFSVQLHWLPSSGRAGLSSIILPAVTLGAPLMALVTRLVRSGMLDTMSEDYIRTARAKGLTDQVVIYGHALKNILVPLVTVVGIQLGFLLGGAVITETVFAWPGVGRLVVTAIFARDYPLVQAATLVISVFFVVINLVLDILYVYIDPRIRYS